MQNYAISLLVFNLVLKPQGRVSLDTPAMQHFQAYTLIQYHEVKNSVFV